MANAVRSFRCSRLDCAVMLLLLPKLSPTKFMSFVPPSCATFGTAGRSESTTYAITRAIAMIDLAPQRDPDSVLMTRLAGATKQCILELEE